ncbi:SpoIIE family protein phosphatase [Actinoplanes sp. KI2]|uniref:PP2C family protein-serine/threonine phosphatase n=1 Tax=Actinoplanes sp. KI2 TaxID=2983315 RepID=UPI0021D5D2A7|nr:protein phosphatase 2C domain-containing protein [Actinoplanes sp. KI2]MCU7729151.1 SpoIIE family protein phosphatase [Actinoplanes sp. KI2]
MEIEKVAWNEANRRLTAAAGSVVGNRYDDNYDVVHLDPGRALAVVADGMGEGAGSAAAGRTTVDVFVRDVPKGCVAAALRVAVDQAQQEVRRAARTLDELTGCTMTAFVADAHAAAWIVQIGDSRAYRLRGGLLELLTTDHTIAWLGLLNGWFTPDSPEGQTARYRLTRYVGHPDSPEPDVLNVSLQPGDVYLLCTDGVTDQLSYERLNQLLGTTPDPAEVVHHLLTDTIEAGGADNATAVVIRVEPTI